MVTNCAKWLEVVCATLNLNIERRAPSAERRAPSAERRGHDGASAAGATPPAIAA